MQFVKTPLFNMHVRIKQDVRTVDSLHLKLNRYMMPIISSPEPLGSQGELMVYPWSGVRRPSVRRRPQCSNIFFLETAWPIKAKFYVEPPWEGGTKVYINGPGHMTKMAAMPIYGIKLKKSSSPKPEVL